MKCHLRLILGWHFYLHNATIMLSEMKKSTIVLFVLFFTIFILNIFKKQYVFYLPFEIPGKQMAATVPPFGVFIESRYKNENKNSPTSIYMHEKVHWSQYEKMGLFSFYFNYIKSYINAGRFQHWMEEEARNPIQYFEKNKVQIK